MLNAQTQILELIQKQAVQSQTVVATSPPIYLNIMGRGYSIKRAQLMVELPDINYIRID